MVMVGWLAACSRDAVDPEVAARVSLDLRGVRPSVAELDELELRPGRWDYLVDGWLRDPRFGDRVRDVLALAWRTRLDTYTPQASEFGLPPSDDVDFQRSVGEEVLRLGAEVAEADLDWRELVTADWTLVDDHLAAVWPVDPEPGKGWRRARYVDGRPAAGVLSTNGAWWRYTTTMENYNRGRANAIARILLCSDFLARPVAFPRSDAAPGSDALLDQTKTDPSCTVCHFSLDPLGSYLYGFDYWVEPYYMTPEYSPAAEALWRGRTEVPPSYFGQEAPGLDGLGRAVAGDPRFTSCAVEQVLEGVLQRDVSDADFGLVARHLEVFEASERRMRPLFRSAALDPENVGPGRADKLLPPESLTASVEALTGFRWVDDDGREVLGNDLAGVRTLAGGYDGKAVTQPLRRSNPTVVLVHRRLAELAATHAVTHPDNPLFQGRSPTDVDDDELLEHLFRATLSRRPDAEEADLARELRDTVAAAEGAEAGWAAVTALLLRHPDFVTF